MKTRKTFEITGEALKAGMAAYTDFNLTIKGQDDGSSLGKYLAKIESYDVEIKQAADQWIVAFFPRDTDIRGGGGEYKISKKDFKIMDKTFFK